MGLGISYDLSKRITLELAYTHSAGKEIFIYRTTNKLLNKTILIDEYQQYKVKEKSNVLFSNVYWNLYNNKKIKLYMVGGVGMSHNALSYNHRNIRKTFINPPYFQLDPNNSYDDLSIAKQRKISLAGTGRYRIN